MFDAADILVHIHPVFRILRHGRRVGAGGCEAGEIPRRIDKRIHRVGFTLGRLATGRACAVTPCRVAVQRVARFVKRHIIGQLNRQVLFLFGHHTAIVTMHHRNRATPITLTGKTPIAQAIVGDPFAPTLFLGIGDCGVDGFLPCGFVQTGEVIDPFDFLFLGRNEGLIRDWCFVFEIKERVDHRQIVFAAEIKVALVMRRAGKDRAGAIVHQDEVRDPDGQFPIRVQRVLHLDASIITQLLSRFDGFLGRATFAAFGQELGQFWVPLFQLLGNRMVWGDPNKRRAHQRVWASRIDSDRVRPIRAFKAEFQTTRFADPVFLHQTDLGRPVVQTV